ncbi:hypothetical protein BJV82DRAFT_219089 [Fennellomyces sp. T-0311]|nr:hypothetical protein BJV82DRAFT_219089 [Fennellomyces sp. T-0311]
MTGDGVNNSPSPWIADVGIAMGKNGSDVAKKASDIVLTDGSFATIIRAIAEGHRIYQNIQRFLLHYYIVIPSLALAVMSCLVLRDSPGLTVAPVSTTTMISIYAAVTPPASALSVQSASAIIMEEPPRPPTESIVNREILTGTFTYSIFAGITCAVAFFVPLYSVGGEDVQGITKEDFVTHFRARSSLLVTYLLCSLVAMTHCRSGCRPEWSLRGLKMTFTSHTVIGTLFIRRCLSGHLFVCPVVAIKGYGLIGII